MQPLLLQPELCLLAGCSVKPQPQQGWKPDLLAALLALNLHCSPRSAS